jgi:hypothetical protein
MSYDIYLRGPRCPHCQHSNTYGSLPNPTYNLTPIFDFALTGDQLSNPDIKEMDVVLFRTDTDRPRGLRLLSGKNGSETIEILAAALNRMNDPELIIRFRALEPDNGWGTFLGAHKVIEDLLAAARECPTYIWEIW